MFLALSSEPLGTLQCTKQKPKPIPLASCSFYDFAMVESILLRCQNVMLSAPVELELDSLHGHCEGRRHFSSNVCGCKVASLETNPSENSGAVNMDARGSFS